MAGSAFSSAFGGGLGVGSSLADIFFEGKNRRKLGQLEQLFKSGDYNNAGAMLAGMGQTQQGVNTLNIPYERQQQELQRDFQNQTFMDNRDFRNQQADFMRQNTMRDDEFRQGQAEWQRQQAAKEDEWKRNVYNQSRVPENFVPVDPNNPTAGVTPIPGSPADPAYLESAATAKGAGKPKKYTDLPVHVQKEVTAADEAMRSGNATISNMTEALRLNTNAYDGLGAGVRGYGMSLVGNEGGEATVDLDNLVKGSALESLKATFGGMPTEGERKILLEISGSSSLPAPVREKIYTRAIAASIARMEYNRRKAAAMRDGSYYDVGFDNEPPPYEQYLTRAQEIANQIKNTVEGKDKTRAVPNGSQTVTVVDDDLAARLKKYE